ARRARRPRPARARRRRRGVLRPEPLSQPDERLPRQVQVLRVREDAEAGRRVHDQRRRARRGRGAAVRGCAVHGDSLRERREPARRPRVLRRRPAQAARRAARRASEVLHRLRDPPHVEARGLHARRGAARAARRRAGLAAGRGRRDLRRARPQPDRARQGAGGGMVPRPRHGASHGYSDPLHAAVRARRDLRGADRPHAAPARAAGCDGRVPRLHPARVPSREHRLRAARLPAHDRRRRPEDDRCRAADARQHPEREGVLDHDGHADGAARAALRRQRRAGHGRAREDLPGSRRDERDRAEDSGARPVREGGGPHPRAAGHALQRAAAMVKLGRISYVNMAPVFYRVDAEVEEVQGVPTQLNRMLLDGELDTAPISSIEYARNADKLRLLPRLCVASEGAVDSIQLVSRKPLEQVRVVAVTPESATSVALTKVLLPEAELVPLGEEADAKLLIGDAALKWAFEDPTPHYDLGRLWLERTGLPMVFAVWACPEPLVDGLAELEDALVSSVRLARAEPEQLAYEAAEHYGYPPGFLARY